MTDYIEYPSSEDVITMNQIPHQYLGWRVRVGDYICSSCLNPMFNMSCKHIAGQLNENGKRVIALIKKVEQV